jgi:hypothetical protein
MRCNGIEHPEDKCIAHGTLTPIFAGDSQAQELQMQYLMTLLAQVDLEDDHDKVDNFAAIGYHSIQDDALMLCSSCQHL